MVNEDECETGEVTQTQEEESEFSQVQEESEENII
jgi:hypothetical protein